MNVAISTMIMIANVIQSGLRTHHQDQLMTSQSLRAINKMVNNPAKPIPDELFEFWLLILFYLVCCLFLVLAPLWRNPLLYTVASLPLFLALARVIAPSSWQTSWAF